MIGVGTNPSDGYKEQVHTAVSGPVQEGIQQFVVTREATSYPVAVSRWDNSDEDKI
jgi:hypothetical protein